MRIGLPKETWPGEARVALMPANVKRLRALGIDVLVEEGAGAGAHASDAEYREAGAVLEPEGDRLLGAVDLVVRVRKPSAEQAARLRRGAAHVSFLDPFNEKPLVQQLAVGGVTAISMEMIPRTTRAQKMDALSSQASLAGYMTVIVAATYSPRIFPMMMTPAGTISPARVFVIGAGVAGLQAIATAKRLGARVEAFDTRSVVAEQVQSLGAKFVQIDLGETGQTAQGYARELTARQLELQRQGMKRVVAASDVVITTAQVFGRPAPRIVARDMIEAMRPGSVVVDMAIESGGNVEGTVLNEVVDFGGVSLVGLGNLPSSVARNASEMYGNNVVNLLEEFWDKDAKTLRLDSSDDILKGCVVTRDGAIVNETIKAL